MPHDTKEQTRQIIPGLRPGAVELRTGNTVAEAARNIDQGNRQGNRLMEREKEKAPLTDSTRRPHRAGLMHRHTLTEN